MLHCGFLCCCGYLLFSRGVLVVRRGGVAEVLCLLECAALNRAVGHVSDAALCILLSGWC